MERSNNNESARIVAPALMLIGSLIVRVEAGRMSGQEKMGMLALARTGLLTGAAGHRAVGTVVLHVGIDGAALALKEVVVDKIPDGRVYLAKGGDHRQGAELGRLTEFSGTITFPLPKGVDPEMFKCVVLWCEKFSVEIGRAMRAGDKM